MNDNIIKMFIGGEEVVSNKEFTINEEMLSASSTILNNCYPASWEETKDYVSNFYYPKDYSKYILGKGNFKYGTDRYTKLNVSGIFPTFETNTEKPFDEIQIDGKSTQATSTDPVSPSPDYPSEVECVKGKNLFDEEHYNNTGLYTKSTPYFAYVKMPNNFKKKFYASGVLKGTSKSLVFGFSNNTTTVANRILDNGTLTTVNYDFTNDDDVYFVIGNSQSVDIARDLPLIFENYNIMVSEELSSYLPYNTIQVKDVGKNLYDLKIDWKFSVTSYNISKNKLVVGTGGTLPTTGVETYLDYLKPNTTYTLSYKASSTNNTQGVIIGTGKNTGSITGLYSSYSSGNVQITFKTPDDTSDLIIWFYGIRGGYYENASSTYEDIQLEKGIQATEYEPYTEEVVNIDLKGNELCSLPNGTKDEVNITNGEVSIVKRTKEFILDENKKVVLEKVLTNTTRFLIYDVTSSMNDYPSAISTHFKYLVDYNSDTEHFYITRNGAIYLFVNKSIASTVDEFKTWLSKNNVKFLCELATPTEIDLGEVDTLSTFKGINNVSLDANMETNMNLTYLWKNYDVLFAGIVKNSGDISLRPTDAKYCSLQILDYKTFLSESDTLDFVISDKTIAEAISMVVDAISGYGFILGTINISQADDVIGAYSTLNKTAYDVFQYLANISGSRWRARFVDNDTMAIDFYDPELLPRANDIDYTQQYWEDNKIVDLTFNYGTRDYRNKQIILSDEVYGGIDYTEVLLSNGYGTSYITQNNIANITSITVNGVKAEVITQSEKDLGVDADFYYTPGKNVVESTTSYSAGTQIIITYTPLVKGRQIVYNDEEVTRIATQTNTTGVISRYENRNDILSSDELENIAETYIKYKGKPEIILKLTTLNNDLFNIGEICYFNSPISDLAQDYMVKSKATNYTSVAGETNIFYTYELTSSFNSEKAINYFDNQRNKTTGNIAEGESITRNIDINNSAMIIWENATITEISVSVDGDNALNSILNSPFIQ